MAVTVGGVAGGVPLRPLQPRIAPQGSSHGACQGKLESSDEGEDQELGVCLESLLVSSLNAVELLGPSTETLSVQLRDRVP